MERGCINFKCLRKRGHFCCADCRERDVCRQGPCQNSPELCGLVRDTVPRAKEAKEYAEARKDCVVEDVRT